MSNAKDFVHLHVHTEYSLLDGLAKIDPLMARVNELGMSSVAITDHGTMFGVVNFSRAARRNGIKPIIGMEAYLARRGMEDRDPNLDSRPYHMLLLAKNEVGYQNLLKLASEAQLRGYYYRPRIDKELMAQYSEGLIATSGCMAAEIPRMVEQQQDDTEIRNMIGWYQDVFGPENFYLELQEHDIEQIHVLNKWLVGSSKTANVPLVATNDVHYVRAEDYDPHDTLICIQTGSTKHEEKRMRMTDPSYHLRTPEEMWRLFGEVPEALTNTVKIAEMCDVELEHEGYHLPIFPVPDGYTEKEYLRHLCLKGLVWRYGERANDPVVTERLDYELGIIDHMGFNTYFLIVWDLCEFARHADIWWNVRGSGAGSVAAYSLGITSIDPLQNSLIFERFLNPGRVSMPDIDLDYPDDRRGEMIEYTAAKYGEDKVAAIITFGTMGSKAAIRDVGRAFDMPLSEVNRVAGMLPSGAKPVKFKDAFGDDPGKAVPELKEAYKTDQDVRKLIDTARSLEGVVRHASTHAAGVIVADRPLYEYIPLHRPTKGSAEDAPVKMVTQFDMETCESIGLLKVDFLGLSTLTIMRKACELVERYHGIHYTMENIPYRPDPNDPEKTRMVEETFEMIGRGETIGVFQIESAGMRRMLTEMQPRTFEHIIAAISLYRPGPMDYIPTFNRRLHGQEPTEYKHDKLIPILEETYGIIVYQEQIMQIASELFGYSLGDADLMRRAVAKKKKEKLMEHKGRFMERGPEYGVDAASAEAIFDDIEFFARYGFNKCLTRSAEIVDADTGEIVTIGELVDGVKTIERTLTFDTDTLRLGPGTVTHVHDNGVKPVYRLTTQLGRQIEATANHPFYTADGWRLLGELVAGDEVAVTDVIANTVRALAPAGAGFVSPPTQAFWDKVVSIEYVGDQPTFDLTVDDTHNFVANDFIVHNSHAADYAVITCQTAFLKTHYPVEYMTALLSVQRDDTAKVSHFTAECRRMGIAILQPDVNHSELDFSVEKSADGRPGIRYGLAAIKNAGVGPLEHIIAQRDEGGQFADLGDFCKRVDLRIVQKRALESLIKVGALDIFGTRPQLLAVLDRMLSYSAEQHRAADVGQLSLFGETTGVQFDAVDDLLSNLPDLPEATQREMLDWEKELVGLYVTSHPLDSVLDFIQSPYSNIRQSTEIKELVEQKSDDWQAAVVGLVEGLRPLITKRGDSMAILTLEDLQGQLDAVMFPRTWEQYKDIVSEGAVLRVMGKVDASRGDVQIIVDSVSQDFELPEEVDGVMRPAALNFPPLWGEEEAGSNRPAANRPYEEGPRLYAADTISTVVDDDDDYDDDDDLNVPPPLPPQEPPPRPAYVAPATAGGVANAPNVVPQVAAPAARPPAVEPVRAASPSQYQPVARRAPAGQPAWAVESPVAILADEEEAASAGLLVVYFDRTENGEQDRRRLRRLHGHLIQEPGPDHFRIILNTPVEEVVLDFPNATTSYGKSLVEELEKIDHIRLVWQPGE